MLPVKLITSTATLFFLSILFSQKLYTQNDSLLINSCSFYDSLETHFQCDNRGYPLSYGKKFCLKFLDKRGQFSEDGQQWIDSTMLCLMKHLNNLDPDLSCKALRKEAFASHIPCYIDNGYCNLSKEDRKLVYKIAIPSSVFHPRVWNQGIKVLQRCREEK